MSILGHWVGNPGGETVWVSPELAGHLWGEAAPRIVSRQALEGATLQTDRESVRAAEARVCATGLAETVSFVLITVDGRRTPVRQVLCLLDDGTHRSLVRTIEEATAASLPTRPGWAAGLGRALEQASSSAIAVADSRGEVITSYNRLSAVTGLDPARLKQPGGARLLALGDQAADPNDASRLLDAIEANPGHAGRENVRLKNGRIIERYTAPIDGGDGQLLGRIWYFRDVTAAERTAEGLRLLADANALLVSSLDPQEILERLARLLVSRIADWCFVGPLSADSPVAVGPVVVTSDEGRAPLARAIMESWERGILGDPPAEYAFFRPVIDGESILLPRIEPGVFDLFGDSEARDVMRGVPFRSAIVVPLRAEDRMIGVLAVATSTSGRVYDEDHLKLVQSFGLSASLAAANAQRFADLRRIGDELRKANQAKDELIGIVSHELRTPLTIIQGGASMLRNWGSRLSEQERDDVLADMEEAASRLQVMVENMLLLARAELTHEIALEPVLGHRVIREAIDRFTRQHTSREIVPTLEEVPPLAARSTFIEEVVTNLLINADRYSPPELPIEVTLGVEEGRAVVRVLDRGFGITPEEEASAFEPFYRSGRAQLNRGAGLGLPACKRMVEAMGGEIWIRSRPGGGAEAGFSVPLYGEEEDE
ncbi:MAG: hypothetical protein Kow0010_02460 [Dehalococcoidia bacterium]